MTLYEFNALALNERMEVVNQQGAFIENHITKLERCNLYAVYRFFAEVVYNSDTNSITEIRSFNTGYLLDKYSVNFD
ncbi:hypothetical protein SAMN05428642_101882 [Flaviramulus basaltis]|uniref:Uncharacterized protein n=1 Tax=Flaviramulus basaltis TaxID=369401 RepID=A0A1K2ID76_9FLAO|nr:hypothetical protein [Flaviramulus basaltis]SFZ90345.1 hypothetical protein SAMN05428642_101882 [Flaviramulus basaltis]